MQTGRVLWLSEKRPRKTPVEIVEMPQEELFPKRSQPRPAAQEENIDKTSASEPTANRDIPKTSAERKVYTPKMADTPSPASTKPDMGEEVIDVPANTKPSTTTKTTTPAKPDRRAPSFNPGKSEERIVVVKEEEPETTAKTTTKTPTNLILIGILEKLFPEAPPITFFTWLKIGLPLVFVLLPVFCFYLIRYFDIKGDLSQNDTVIKDELKALGKITPGEKRVIYVCLLAIFGWVFRDDLVFGNVVIPGWASLLGLGEYVHDSTVAIVAALLLFMLPATKETRLLDWKAASQVPWGVAMIVGGGYAIAAGFESTGLADWLGNQLVFINQYQFFIVMVLVIGFVMIFTEFNSNTATANILLPVLASMAVAAAINPLLLMIPAAVASSLGFMMPAGTGPNTVIFGSERVTVADMVKCGFWLDLISLLIVVVMMYFIIMPWLGFDSALPQWAI